MRLAISNIAWDAHEDASVARRLRQHRIDAIDVAHSKYFPDPKTASEADIRKVKNWWRDAGIEITGMQALLFGTAGLNLFGGADLQEDMLTHLHAVCRIGAGLGATRLVFGSPKNRDRGALADEEAADAGVRFFQRLGIIAQENGVVICLEPNPACYGCNFMTTTDEAAQIVRMVDHPAIQLHLDSGTVFINGESASSVLAAHADIIGHIHASEPHLATLGDTASDHGAVALALAQHLPDSVVSIEMVASKSEPHGEAIERALQCAIHHYRPEKNIVEGVLS